ncbi:MAG: helix-turn-helix domain-containing protein [Christensenellales bacterium]
MKKSDFHGNKNVISGRIKQAREAMGLSQAALAAKLQVMNVNLDQQMISKIERNLRIVTDYELAVFCRALHVDEKWLLNDYYSSRA